MMIDGEQEQQPNERLEELMEVLVMPADVNPRLAPPGTWFLFDPRALRRLVLRDPTEGEPSGAWIYERGYYTRAEVERRLEIDDPEGHTRGYCDTEQLGVFQPPLGSPNPLARGTSQEDVMEAIRRDLDSTTPLLTWFPELGK